MAETYSGVTIDNLNFNEVGQNVSSLTVIISDSNTGVDGTYDVEPNVLQGYIYFGATPVDTTFTNFRTFGEYPFCIACVDGFRAWRLVLPALSVVGKPTLDLSIQIIAHTKETVVSDDFKKVVEVASGGVMSVVPFNDSFTATGLPSEAGTYHTASFPVTTDESEARGGNYILYRQNSSTNGYDIAVIGDKGNTYWCPIADILLINVKANVNIVGTGVISVNRTSKPTSMDITFITNGETSLRFRLAILVNSSSLIGVNSGSGTSV